MSNNEDEIGENDMKYYFRRQMIIPDWDQEVLETKTALLLGAGGLGTGISQALCRLGIAKLYMVDIDVVDPHNLNRQTLYSKAHIDKNKVESSVETLENLHNLRTEIIGENVNVLTEWGRIVEMAKDSDVIFNGVDVGEYLDAAVQSLCVALNIPLVVGGTYQNSLTIDYIKPSVCPCWWCISGLDKKEILDQLLPDKILTHQSIDFIPRDPKPKGASNVMVCTLCCHMMVTQWINDLFKMGGISEVVPRLLFYTTTMEIFKWELEPLEGCQVCAYAKEHNSNKEEENQDNNSEENIRNDNENNNDENQIKN